MTYELIIFDLDGTLIDSSEGIAIALNNVLEKLGVPVHDIDDYKGFVGEGRRRTIWKALPESHRKKDIEDQCFEMMNKEYEVHFAKGLRLYDGLNETLNTLKEMGIKMAVNTNKNQFMTDVIMDKLFTQWEFVGVIGNSDNHNRKPAPDGANRLIEMAGVSPDKCLYVGDTQVDMETARNAGIDAVGVLWGFRTAEVLAEYNPVKLMEDPRELLALFK